MTGNEVVPIVVYTAPGCPHSRAAVEDLRRRGVRFLEIDVTADREALERLLELTWEHRLPVIADHERLTIGWQGRSSTFEELGIHQRSS